MTVSGLHVVVTGAGGFVGGRVSKFLLERGHRVIACYRKTRPDEMVLSHAGCEAVAGDLVQGLPLPGRIDALVHCAADIPALCPDGGRLYQSNLQSAVNIFRSALDAGAGSIVNLSSMSVYGRISVSEVIEDLLPDHPDSYGASKMAVEGLLKELADSDRNLSALSIRLPGVVGMGSHHNFLSGVMQRIVEKKPVTANSPDALFNNIVYVDDLSDFIAARIETAPAGHEVTNIAARGALPIRDVLSELYAAVGMAENVIYVSEGKAPFLISTEHVKSLGYDVPTVRESLWSFGVDVMSSLAGQAGKSSIRSH